MGAPVAWHGPPSVVISHGSGGWFGGHYDTALVLAHAGFAVARRPTTETPTRTRARWRRSVFRPAQLHRLIDYMLADAAGS